MSEKILLIEDDLEMSSLIADYLQNYDFDVQAFDKPKEALAHLKNHLGEPLANSTKQPSQYLLSSIF